jgi:hypothetical protein
MRTDERFTIGVGIVPENANVGFGDLVLSHLECGSGRIVQREDYHGRWWYLKCSRCSSNVQLDPSSGTTGAIALTAADGRERALEDNYRRCFAIRVDEAESVSVALDRSHRYRVILTNGQSLEIRSNSYEQARSHWEFLTGKDELVASFAKHAVLAIVRSDLIVGNWGSGDDTGVHENDEEPESPAEEDV